MYCIYEQLTSSSRGNPSSLTWLFRGHPNFTSNWSEVTWLTGGPIKLEELHREEANGPHVIWTPYECACNTRMTDCHTLCMYIHLHTYICICIHSWISNTLCTYICTCVYVRMYVCICIHCWNHIHYVDTSLILIKHMYHTHVYKVVVWSK